MRHCHHCGLVEALGLAKVPGVAIAVLGAVEAVDVAITVDLVEALGLAKVLGLRFAKVLGIAIAVGLVRVLGLSPWGGPRAPMHSAFGRHHQETS